MDELLKFISSRTSFTSPTSSTSPLPPLTLLGLPDKHATSDQTKTQNLCLETYKSTSELLLEKISSGDQVLLSTKKHEKFAIKGLGILAHYFDGLDASRTWLCYWSVHSLRLMNREIPHQKQIAAFLRKCYNLKTGGFGGGPQQMSHLAPCYSAINALVELQDFEFLNKIKDDKSLVGFINSMKNNNGSFLMHKNGEFDTRSAYCAISCTKLLNLNEVDFSNTFEWLLSCQTYEGGFGGIPGAEAHGGYTFCALAGLILLDKTRLVNNHIAEMMKCLSWLNRRQMPIEGGFNGRTNKLVDACYSFWQGATPVLLKKYVFCSDGDSSDDGDDTITELFNDTALAGYMLGCCQASFGGLIDKPGKGPDFYHTCYGMSGYSLTKMGKLDGLEQIDPLHNVVRKFVDEVKKEV